MPKCCSAQKSSTLTNLYRDYFTAFECLSLSLLWVESSRWEEEHSTSYHFSFVVVNADVERNIKRKTICIDTFSLGSATIAQKSVIWSHVLVIIHMCMTRYKHMSNRCVAVAYRTSSRRPIKIKEKSFYNSRWVFRHIRIGPALRRVCLFKWISYHSLCEIRRFPKLKLRSNANFPHTHTQKISKSKSGTSAASRP